ncbi:hypothetical protein BI364_02990 [Acidihalobacter yilgarnensis]|uniref:HTH gntR-type domain-containing protein n=1 Tax=Acidihalobacter yilgarnensis TaxID=2819280 RepID=A0A1D8ISK3_9GAMM|nr:GntR family transcriptional regulator [Acidihalobacter yilgarnensis]AOU99498.1 hypothetical protein BI364_02990 [Acidihalobacter yilgarnensis]
MLSLPAHPALIDQVYETLRDAICTLDLAPGERLRQAELAERLGVSRQPVSHALQLLKRDGLVQESGRKGLAVAEIDPERIRQRYEVREALDALAARLAARRAGAGALSEAERNALEQPFSGTDGDGAPPAATLLSADRAFHTALYRASGNPEIEAVIAPHWPHLMRAMAVVLRESGAARRTWDEHTLILRHILDGDEHTAAEAARTHAARAGASMIRRLESRQTGPGDRP